MGLLSGVVQKYDKICPSCMVKKRKESRDTPVNSYRNRRMRKECDLDKLVAYSSNNNIELIEFTEFSVSNFPIGHLSTSVPRKH